MYLLTKMNFQGQGFQQLEHYKQMDVQTDVHSDAAFTGGN